MPSSTSSSEPRQLPDGAWRATWLVAVGLTVALLIGVEYVTRAHGQRPSVPEDPVWWSMSRRTIDGDPRVVAFVGTSRLKLAYSPEAFAAAAPELRGVQLSINGAPALGIVEDLANDDAFQGIAVVDLIEWDVGVYNAFTGAAPFVDRSHALWRVPGAVANRFLGTLLQDRLALLALGGRPLLTAWLREHHWPGPMWVVTDRDGTSYGDYTLANPVTLKHKRDWRVKDFFVGIPAPEIWLATLDHDLEPLVKRIRAHGGDVVVLHPPLSGVFANDFDEGYPKARYWDAFAARTTAHAIHFRDAPALASLTCPDEMHLDQRDQIAFTRGLVDAMRARGVFRGREDPRTH